MGEIKNYTLSNIESADVRCLFKTGYISNHEGFAVIVPAELKCIACIANTHIARTGILTLALHTNSPKFAER